MAKKQAVKKPTKAAKKPNPLAVQVKQSKAKAQRRAKASVARQLKDDAKPEPAPRTRTARIPKQPRLTTKRGPGRPKVPVITPADHPVIAELLGRGWTHRRIAEKYGVARETIGQLVRQHISPLLRDETRYHLSVYLNEAQEQRYFCWEQIEKLMALRKSPTAVMPDVVSLMSRIQKSMSLQHTSLRYGINHQANDLIRPPTEDDFRIAGTDRIQAFLEYARPFVNRALELQGMKDAITVEG